MTKACDLFTTDRPYVKLYDSFTKRVVNKYGSVMSMSLLSIFFLWNFTHVSKNTHCEQE